jgi:hypothetical protein
MGSIGCEFPLRPCLGLVQLQKFLQNDSVARFVVI